jgi:hypothetical protein
MKIEIGESLATSYLNHVKGCRVIQTNWKTSGNWTYTDQAKDRAISFYNEIKSKDEFKDIFKETSFDQLIKQAEIDVLGINTSELIIYGIDVAFHGAGINYGSKEETSTRVVKKIFRTLLIMETYFEEFTQFHSLFITPKTNPATQKIVDNLITHAQNFVNENIIIKFITNEQFYSEILTPTIESSNSENDTSELFIRAVKLLQLDPRSQKIETYYFPKLKVSNSTETQVNKMKIGQYVKNSIYNFYKEGKLDTTEILNLQNIEYSKKIFNGGFEILRKSTRSKLDHLGQSRYYKNEIFPGYWLSSQWYEKQWGEFLKWEKNINLSSTNNTSKII